MTDKKPMTDEDDGYIKMTTEQFSEYVDAKVKEATEPLVEALEHIVERGPTQHGEGAMDIAEEALTAYRAKYPRKQT